MTLLRAPGEPKPTKLSAYGECEECHRVVAIARIYGHKSNGEAYGLCQICNDLRVMPATGSGRATPSPAASRQERGAIPSPRTGAPLRLIQGGQ